MDVEPVGQIVHEFNIASYHADGKLADNEVQIFRSRLQSALGCPSDVEMTELKARIDQLQAELDVGDSLDSDLLNTMNRIDQLRSGNDQLRHDLTHAESALGSATTAREKQLVDLDRLRAEFEVVTGKLNNLKSIIEKQNEAGLGHLINHIGVLKERLEGRQQHRNDLDRKIKDLQIEHSRREGKIAPALDEYNALLARLQASSHGNLLTECDLQLCTHQKGFDLAVELPEMLTSLDKCKQKLEAELAMVDRTCLELTQKSDDSQTTLNELTNKLTNLKHRIQQSQLNMEQVDEELEREGKEDSDRFNQLKEKQDQASKQLADVKREIVQLQHELAKIETDLDKEYEERVAKCNYIDESYHRFQFIEDILESKQQLKDTAEQMIAAHNAALKADADERVKRMDAKLEWVKGLSDGDSDG